MVTGGSGPAQAKGPKKERDRRVVDRSQLVIKAAQSKLRTENEKGQFYFWAAVMTKAPSGFLYLGMLKELLSSVMGKPFNSKPPYILNRKSQMGHLGLSSGTKKKPKLTFEP